MKTPFDVPRTVEVVSRGLRRRVGMVLLVAVSGGCCGLPPPPAAKFFDRKSVEETLKGFVYAVDAGEWAYAYESLTSTTRNECSQFKFQAAIRFLDDPKAGVPIVELISNALTLRKPPEFADPRHARIRVATKGRDGNGTLVFFEAHIYLVQEDDEWRIDLLDSLGAGGGAS